MSLIFSTPVIDPFPTSPDHEALDRLLAWAEAEYEKQQQGKPSEWDQGHWAISLPNGTPIDASCATACCMAGRTVAWDGGRFLLEEDPFVGNGRMTAGSAQMPDGRMVEVDEYARRRLGLSSGQAAALFDGDNKIADVRRVIQQIKDGEAWPEGASDYYEDDDDYT